MIEIPNTNNYFDFYGLPHSVEIDKDLLRQKFIEKSKLYHPDFFADNSEDLNKAIEITAFNNKAYKTLSQYYSCAQYLIDLSSHNAINNMNLPQDFLMEMMEINEEIDLLESNQSNKIALLENKIAEFEQTECNQLKESMNLNDYQNAQQSLLKIKYLERLKQRLKTN